MSVEVCL